MHRRAMALILTASLALGACSGDDDDGEVADAGDGAATTTTATATDFEADGTTTTTAGVGGGTGATEPAVGTEAPQPAGVGRYRYEVQQDDRAPTETFLVVQPGEATDAGTYQGPPSSSTGAGASSASAPTVRSWSRWRPSVTSGTPVRATSATGIRM